MDIITDTWGNVPYSQAGKLESEGTLYAAYDSQKDIYTEMIKELTDAVNTIDVSQPAFSSGDVIFGGKAEKWKRYQRGCGERRDAEQRRRGKVHLFRLRL